MCEDYNSGKPHNQPTMPLYRVTSDRLESIPQTTFSAENLLERKDLQKFLRCDISPIGDDLMVISEEFGDWEESTRRIDLLCLTKDASLAVIEIKRTEDGGHMELQAIRYAAMVSGMTMEQAVQAYSRFSGKDPAEAQDEIAEFLEPGAEDGSRLSGEVRIILVSSNFSAELTTAVLWLNNHDLDITCFRLRPYRNGGDILIDASQIIPLPEAADYEVRVRAQEQEQRRTRGVRQQNLLKFWTQLIQRSRTKTQLFANRSPSYAHWLSGGIGRSGFTLTASLSKNDSQVECYISLPGGNIASTAAFNALKDQKDAIEAAFGAPLDWQELKGKKSCRICKDLPGGWGTPESEWPQMQDSIIDGLIRLEAALKQPIQNLVL